MAEAVVTMPGGDDERSALAHRLRMLRLDHWPGRPIKQADLARVMGVTASAMSSWENARDADRPPPLDRLESYATFFATERSVADGPYRLLSINELTSDERACREKLVAELVRLREPESPQGSGIWHFPDGGDVTIVCAKLPNDLIASMPYTDPADPDYVSLYSYADPDALLELFGHVRANNPLSSVKYLAGKELTFSQYGTHLAVLGGVDWNANTRYFIDEANIPVRQLPRADDADLGGFAVGDQVFQPKLRPNADETILVEDVCQIFRTPNPYDNRRTLTMCNASYGRGTLGAVLAFTDQKVRDENESYLRQRFFGADTFSILARVRFGDDGLVVSPRLTDPGVVLHTWAEQR
ncbi:MAG TPA: helix-turn-helix transcriptional regulator [Pseudonocardiaceae bacterium]|nr:helix-turn-helix transcriptional regulator [Pseudonocardiaceae bacterium]